MLRGTGWVYNPFMTFVRHRWTALHTLLAIAGVVLGSIVLPVGFKSCARDTLVASQAPLWGGMRDITTLQDTAVLKLQSKDELIKTIQELARTQAGLELRLKTLDAAEAARGRLEQILKMPAYPGYETKVTRILNRDVNAWWQQIWIDVGEEQGVYPGLGVISRYGVVGRVTKVYSQSSVVELVTSPRFRMAAQMKGDERPFVYQGMGLRFGMEPMGKVEALQPEMALKKSEVRGIITTGLNGSFPEGLLVGELIATDSLSEGGLLGGRVRLSKNLQNLKEVSVLIPYR